MKRKGLRQKCAREQCFALQHARGRARRGSQPHRDHMVVGVGRGRICTGRGRERQGQVGAEVSTGARASRELEMAIVHQRPCQVLAVDTLQVHVHLPTSVLSSRRISARRSELLPRLLADGQYVVEPVRSIRARVEQQPPELLRRAAVITGQRHERGEWHTTWRVPLRAQPQARPHGTEHRSLGAPALRFDLAQSTPGEIVVFRKHPRLRRARDKQQTAAHELPVDRCPTRSSQTPASSRGRSEASNVADDATAKLGEWRRSANGEGQRTAQRSASRA
jgi:hypothetical protein